MLQVYFITCVQQVTKVIFVENRFSTGHKALQGVHDGDVRQEFLGRGQKDAKNNLSHEEVINRHSVRTGGQLKTDKENLVY